MASCSSVKSPTTALPAAALGDESTRQSVSATQREKRANISTLEQAVLELPTNALADIPFSERQIFLDHLREDKDADGAPGSQRLDIKHRYLEFYTDGEVPFHATSMLYVKVFTKSDGGVIVFCHMPKPQADGLPARANQTFFFERRKDQWIDVTDKVLPKGIDRMRCFRPQRTTNVIEAGDYAKAIVRPGGGHDYKREFDLFWDGRKFTTRKAPSHEFTLHSPKKGEQGMACNPQLLPNLISVLTQWPGACI